MPIIPDKLKLPEGYIAPGVFSYVSAVDSGTLAKNGAVHGPTPALHRSHPHSLIVPIALANDLVEFSIKGDKRLDMILPIAKFLGEHYATPGRKSYIADTAKREAFITKHLMEEIHKHYDKYSFETIDNNSNKGELKAADKTGFFKGETTNLSDMEAGSLVCRHLAPIMCAALNEAKVKSHLISSSASTMVFKDGKYAITSDKYNKGLHMFVVTDEGNAVVEATLAGVKDKPVYRPILNKVTTQDIVMKGSAALTAHMLYGGHKNFSHYAVAETEEVQQKVLDSYNQDVKKSFESVRQMLQSATNELTSLSLPFGFKEKTIAPKR